MPALSWNEIRQRAIQFSREWSEVSEERAEAQTFWNELFAVFGVRRRTVASFEEKVLSIRGTYHRIDLFWKGRLLAEHKSRGESLEKAQSQAFNYIQELVNEGRRDECPRYVAISDFARIHLYDLEPDGGAEAAFDLVEIPVSRFHEYIKHFAFIPGLKTQRLREQDPANLEAAAIMARLHDTLEEAGYSQSDLERLLVRILFCLFADDTGIFEPDSFVLYIENRTTADGSDLGPRLAHLFEVLNTPEDKRSKNLDEDLAAFPYINGELFAERLHFADFNRDMRNALLAACRFQWARISPAIFGSLFQGVMEPGERRQIGAHYTSERDILKLIGPLFLDELRAEFEQLRADRSTRRKQRLGQFGEKLAALKFLDPACGCGNFLVIAYRELRQLELEALLEIHGGENLQLLTAPMVQSLSRVDVDQFYGIEIEEWPSRIAETALWLTDHQMNMRLSEAFGQIFLRIPLRKSPHIRCANALRMDWNDLLPATECNYVLGNPPFVGKKARNIDQQRDMAIIFDEKGAGILDYVCCWYVKAGEYIKGTKIRGAFVSTNSISQGEQPGIIWPILWGKCGLRIHFAHRTFAWQLTRKEDSNGRVRVKGESAGIAHVHVIIIGFGVKDQGTKLIYEYDDIYGEGHAIPVRNINPYLIEANDFVLSNRTDPICDVKEMNFGNMPNDDGHLLLTDEEKQELLKNEPEAEKFIRPIISAKEYFNGIERWCIWLHNVPPSSYRNIKSIRKRIESVKKYREVSKRSATTKLAEVPYLFGEIRQPNKSYVLLPRHSSERRNYIPFAFFRPKYIAHDSCLTLPDATLYHFGILSSAMHMAWVRQVCGRLKSDFRYSAKLVYNNYPWPQDAGGEKRAAVEGAAQKVLDVREKYIAKGSTLADLYDPLYMPADLLKAHQALDRAVDRCYRGKKFDNERERLEFLFALYERLTSPLMPVERKKRRGRKSI